jgi:hypothetical protein
MQSDIPKTGFFHTSLRKDISLKASSPHSYLTRNPKTHPERLEISDFG